MPIVDRGKGVVGSLGVKPPCIAATTANITLFGEQTIDDIDVVADDRVLVKDQDEPEENGIYVVTTVAWERAPDFDGIDDVANGTMVPVALGTTNGNTLWSLATAGDITIGTTLLTFEAFATAGNANIAVQAAADALLSEQAAAAYAASADADRIDAQAAAASAASDAASIINLDILYLGPKASDPTLDNEGNALLDGAVYFNTVIDSFKVYDLGTTSWAVAYQAGSGTGDMLAANNLSDLTDIAQARTNLGLGDAATGDIGVDVQAYDAQTAKTDVEQTFTAQQTPMSGTLTDGATIDWNGDSNGQIVSVTTAAARSFNAPTNINQNALYILILTTGGFTPSWNAAYKWPAGVAPSGLSGVCVLTFLGGAGNTLLSNGVQIDVR